MSGEQTGSPGLKEGSRSRQDIDALLRPLDLDEEAEGPRPHPGPQAEAEDAGTVEAAPEKGEVAPSAVPFQFAPLEESQGLSSAWDDVEGPEAAGEEVPLAPASPGPSQPERRATNPHRTPAGHTLEKPVLDRIRDIPVELSALLGEAELHMRNVLQLAPGAVVGLNTHEGEPVRIFANGVEIARGEVMVVGDHYGVRITDIVSPAHRLGSFRDRD